MSINAFGTDGFLRHQIERRLNYLEKDDQLIYAEGVDSLSIPELHQICQSRGIRVSGMSPARLRSELSQWLDLHLEKKIPPSLLILSRAFQISDRIVEGDQALQESAEALQATLSSLPDQMVNEAQLKVSEAEGVATYKQKLQVLQEQEELIADELEQEAKQAASNREKEQIELQAAQEVPIKSQADLELSHPDTSTSPGEISKSADLSIDELKTLGVALKTLTHDSAVEDVRLKLADLKEDRKEFKEDIEELSELVETTQPSLKSATKLGARVDMMIASLEKQLTKYDKEVGSTLNIVRPDKQGQISIQDLESALKLIRNHPNDERIKAIVAKLDADADGLVALPELISLVEEAEASDVGIGCIKKKSTEKN